MGKRQPLNPVNQNTPIEPPEFRSIKMEKSNRVNHLNRNDRFQEPIPKRRRSDRPHPTAALTGGGGGEEPARQEKTTDVRVLRSNYQAVKTLINEEKEEICKGESDRFQKIMGEVNRLHEHVTMPREQVTDAETLLDMADTLVTCVRAHSKEGFTPADFVSCLLREFGTHDSIKWNAVGVLVCPIFQNGGGCCTMIGPMNSQLKQRKVTAPRKRTKLTGSAARPEQLEHSGDDEKTDTDKNMATMFNILRKEKAVKLENLILNRFSFAQTVENLFALSFLAKDGRVQITADEKGSHTVSPRNAPNADVVATGDVVYDHFVFRFDFQDWKLMTDTVSSGKELMPHRYQVSIPMSQADILCNDSMLTAAAIPTANVSANPGSGHQCFRTIHPRRCSYL